MGTTPEPIAYRDVMAPGSQTLRRSHPLTHSFNYLFLGDHWGIIQRMYMIPPETRDRVRTIKVGPGVPTRIVTVTTRGAA